MRPKRDQSKPPSRKHQTLGEDGLLCAINQRRHAKALRIAPRRKAPLQNESSLNETPVAVTVKAPDATDRLLADLATCLWDIERKLKPLPDQEIDKKHRLAYRRAIKGLDALLAFGVKIEDLTGKPVPVGAALKMNLLPTPGTTEEVVADTVSPTIYLSERPIQLGEVWVAVAPPSEHDGIGSQSAAAGANDVSQAPAVEPEAQGEHPNSVSEEGLAPNTPNKPPVGQ